MKWLASMLSEKGSVSAMRSCMVAWFAVLIAEWAVESTAHRALAEIPASVITLSGMLLTAKLVQKNQETQEPK